MLVSCLNLILIISIILIFIKFIPKFTLAESERIIGFYLIFTNLIILILINTIDRFHNILDIILILFLLKLAFLMILLIKNKSEE